MELEGAISVAMDVWAVEGLAPSTKTQYRALLGRWWRWAEGEGHDPVWPSPDAVADWGDTLPPGVSTRDQAASTMRWWCRIVGADRDIAGCIRRPEPNKRPRPPLARRQAGQFLLAADGHGHRGLTVWLALYCAMRVSEVVALRREDVDLDAGMVTFRRQKQGGAWHTVPLAAPLAAKLAPELPGEGWWFPGRNGGHIATGTAWKWIKAIGADAGMPDVQPHDLRRTGGRTVYELSGRDIEAAREFLGHAKVTTTSLYLAAGVDVVADALEGFDYLDAA